MPVLSFEGHTPRVHPSAFVAPNAIVIGNVEIGEGASIWYGVVIRGDLEPIRIGARSNVQDGSVIHTDSGSPCDIGDDVTIGHMACVHGCRVGRGALVGIGAIVLTGAVLGDECVIGAGALVPEGAVVEAQSLMLGVPAKRVRSVTADELARFARGTAHYVANGRRHAAALRSAEDHATPARTGGPY